MRGGSHTDPDRPRYYKCSRRKYEGKARCEGTTVRVDRILLAIADHLERWLGFDGEANGMAAYYRALKPGDLTPEFADAFNKVKRLLMMR
jgi:hypothetical protein